MPVAAVICGGNESVSSGSRSAIAGQFSTLPTLILAFATLSASTDQMVSSLPVPAVVGTAITGAPALGTLPMPT